MDGSGKLKLVSSYKPRKYHPYRVSRVRRREFHRAYDRIYATLYGHCVGDAIGLLTEGLTREEVKKHYKEVYERLEFVHKKVFPDAHRRRWKQADWTDETDQMILILQSIIHNKAVIDLIDFAKRLTSWSEQGFPDLGDESSPGVCSQVKSIIGHPQFSESPLRVRFFLLQHTWYNFTVEQIRKASEIVWRDSGQLIASNSAVARTAVLGIHQYDTVGQVIRNAVEVCKATHFDPRCQASCVAVSTAVALMLQKNEKYLKKNGKFNIDSLINECFLYASRILDKTRQVKDSPQVKELRFYMYCTSLKDLDLDEPGRISYTYKALGAGFWALRQKDFRQAIQAVVLQGGDADANGAVAGALLGCKLGLDALPRTWVENLTHRLWLDEFIDQYFDMMERKRNSKETIV